MQVFQVVRVVLSSPQLKNLSALFAPPTPLSLYVSGGITAQTSFKSGFMVRLSLWIGTLLVYQCSLVDGNQCYVLTHVCLDCMEFQSSFFNSRERPSLTMSVRV